jgi:hypothetical protein
MMKLSFTWRRSLSVSSKPRGRQGSSV